MAFVSGSGEGGIGPEVLYGDTDIKLRLMSRKALNTQSVSTNYPTSPQLMMAACLHRLFPRLWLTAPSLLPPCRCCCLLFSCT